MKTAASNRRKVCATCRYCAALPEAYESPRGLVYGYCYKYGTPRAVGTRSAGCSSWISSGRRRLSDTQMAAVILHTLKIWEGWGDTRLNRLMSRTAETLREMQGDEVARGYSADDLVKEYEKFLQKMEG